MSVPSLRVAASLAIVCGCLLLGFGIVLWLMAQSVDDLAHTLRRDAAELLKADPDEIDLDPAGKEMEDVARLKIDDAAAQARQATNLRILAATLFALMVISWLAAIMAWRRARNQDEPHVV